MNKSIADILAQVDAFTADSKASEKIASAPVSKKEVTDILKELTKESQEKVASSQNSPGFNEESMTETEKLAMALAVAETVFSRDELRKMVDFEKSASEKGFSDESINSKLEEFCAQTGAGSRAQEMWKMACDFYEEQYGEPVRIDLLDEPVLNYVLG